MPKPPWRAHANPSGPDTVPIDEAVDFTREETAAVLAAVHPLTPRRWGKRTVLNALRKAADERLDVTAVDNPAAVDIYLGKLADLFDKIAKPRSPGGPPKARVLRHHEFTLDQAAALLAALHPTLPRRAGVRTAHEGLGEAIQKGLSPPDEPTADSADAVRQWRDLLIATSVFHPEAHGSGR